MGLWVDYERAVRGRGKRVLVRGTDGNGGDEMATLMRLRHCMALGGGDAKDIWMILVGSLEVFGIG